MELVGCVQAVGCTDRPDFFIFWGFLHFFVQEQLDWAFHVLTIFPSLVIGIPLHTRFLRMEMKKAYEMIDLTRNRYLQISSGALLVGT
jgi:hypothetical protein